MVTNSFPPSGYICQQADSSSFSPNAVALIQVRLPTLPLLCDASNASSHLLNYFFSISNALPRSLDSPELSPTVSHLVRRVLILGTDLNFPFSFPVLFQIGAVTGTYLLLSSDHTTSRSSRTGVVCALARPTLTLLSLPSYQVSQSNQQLRTPFLEIFRTGELLREDSGTLISFAFLVRTLMLTPPRFLVQTGSS